MLDSSNAVTHTVHMKCFCSFEHISSSSSLSTPNVRFTFADGPYTSKTLQSPPDMDYSFSTTCLSASVGISIIRLIFLCLFALHCEKYQYSVQHY